MAWAPVLHYSFENRAALDETGNGFHGRVELPGPDRWVDLPAAFVPGAVRFDHPESKIVVVRPGAFAGWRGFRVRALFTTEDLSRRLNLVEGDGSFALFLEPGGELCGTVNDGSPNWWGIFSKPGTVEPGRWYLAKLAFAGQTLALTLDDLSAGESRFFDTAVSAGLPLRPVGPAGIQIGYWPGGDARYTFAGLIGPVWIDRFDERESASAILNKLICGGSDGTSRLEHLDAVMRKELSPSEQEAVRAFGKAVIEAVNRLMAVLLGQAADPGALVNELRPLADELGRLVTAHELAGTDLLADPALQPLLTKVYTAACAGNPAASAVFIAEALRLLASLPVPPERWRDILRRHPEICASAFPPIDLADLPRDAGGDPARWIEDLIDRLCRERSHPQAPPAKNGRCCDGREGAAPEPPPIHVHVHCDSTREPER